MDDDIIIQRSAPTNVLKLDTDEQAQDQNVVGDEYMTITKIVPIYDILAINFDLKTKTLKNLITYDPNKDDPLNKYTYEDKHGGLRPPLTPTGDSVPR